MDRKLKIKELRNIINHYLLPLIDNNYIFLDIPHYPNIGDTLIWQGTIEFLKQIPYKCLYTCSYSTYITPNIDNNTIILLQGGGNWGDLYPKHQEFRKNIIQSFPNNRIIVFPQSIHYQKQEHLLEDINFFKKYSNVTICARDNASFNLLKKYFGNNPVLLVPDMAFFLDFKIENTPINKKRTLFFKRRDKELKDCPINIIPTEAEIHDWPTIEKDYLRFKISNILGGGLKCIFSLFNKKIAYTIKNYRYYYFHRPWYISIGKQFINQYDTIYTTRLHGMILSILLDKKIFLFDNANRKNSNFYHTWLEDLDSIQLIKSEK